MSLTFSVNVFFSNEIQLNYINNRTKECGAIEGGRPQSKDFVISKAQNNLADT